MKNTIKRKIITLVLFVLTAGPMFAAAQNGETRINNPITSNTLDDLVERILNIVITFGIPIYGLMVAIAGFMFVTGAGTPEKRKKAINIVKYATIGFVILLLGRGVVALVRSLI
ncbi:MAG: hypothetical protein R3346_01455 [Candidatus Spechtbacterales bacterium]|nr:hypothetical protein [Candidatus Spechtbacterales bacterium]